MIIAQIINNELNELGEFPSVEEAREVYGQDIIGFNSSSELEEFRQVVDYIRMADALFRHADLME